MAYGEVGEEYLLTLCGASWFDIEALEVSGFVDRYVTDGCLPDHITLQWTRYWGCSAQFACHDADLVLYCDKTLKDLRKGFCENVVRGLQRLNTEVLCSVGEPMFIHLTRGEIEYPERLREISEECLNGWCGTKCVDMATWVWKRAQLHVDFRYLRKTDNYWNFFCRNERRLRSKHSRATSYQFLATIGLRYSVFHR